MPKQKKPSPEQLYKTLMRKIVDSEQSPPCEKLTEIFYADGLDWQVRVRERQAKMLCGVCNLNTIK